MSTPGSPQAGPRRLYRDIHTIIRSRVAGHDEAVAHLALLGTRFELRESGLRTVVIGPHGTGKSTLVLALAEAVGVPALSLDVSQMSESNFQGRDVTDALRDLYVRCGRDVNRMSRTIILLDELDKLATGGTAPMVGVGAAYRLGKQSNLLGLLSGTAEIPIAGAPDEMTWSSHHALIVGAGVFAGLAEGDVGPADLVGLGIMPELADRFGSIVRLGPLRPDAIGEILRKGLVELEVVYSLMDYTLIVEEESLRYVTALVADPTTAYTPRSGLALIKRAAEDALVRLLDGGAPADSLARVHPDDLRVSSSLTPGHPPGPSGSRER